MTTTHHTPRNHWAMTCPQIHGDSWGQVPRRPVPPVPPPIGGTGRGTPVPDKPPSHPVEDQQPAAGKPEPEKPTRRPDARRRPAADNGDTLPGWLADKLTSSRRAAHPRTCPRCGAHTLVGPDHDTCAATARVDPQPADRIMEIVALLRGRHSYDLIGANLHHREIEHIKAARNPYPVLLEHECEKGTLW